MTKKLLQFSKFLLIGIFLNLSYLGLQAQNCPAVFDVSGGGVRCSNGSGVSIKLSNSETGVKYQLVRDGNPVGTAISGTGHQLSFILTTAGEYTMMGTNISSNCTTTMNGSATITVNSAPGISYTQSDVSCNGADGSITVTGSGGTPGYLFNIDGGSFSTTNVYSGLAPGSHTVAVQDANTCTTTKTVNIQAAATLSISISSVDPGDCSGTTGSITASSTGGVNDGVTPYQYKLDGDATVPYQNSNVFTGLSKGNYTVTVKDSKGCTATSSVVSLTQEAGTVPTVFNVTGGGTKCSSDAGTISISLSGSETGVNYQLINNGSSVGSPVAGTGNALTFTSNVAGTYTVLATNATAGCTNGMSGSATIVVNQSPIAFNVSGGGARCSNGSNVSITLSNSETGVKYQLIKNGNPVGSSINGSNNHSLNFVVSIAGTYTILATNATSNCTTTMNGSANVTVNTPPAVFTVSGGGIRCYDASGISVSLSGSETGVNYQLLNNGTPAGSPVAGTGSTINLQAVDAGTYSVMATNATSGCTATMTGSATVSVNPQLTPTYTKYYASSCVGGDGTITVTGHGGTPGYMYSVDNGPFTSDNFLTGLAAGDHRVEIKDANSCTFVWQGITILTAPLMKVNTVRVQPSSCSGNDGSVKAYPLGGVVDGITPLQYQLSGDANVPFQLSNTFTGLGAGNYTITIKDSKGCLADTSITLTAAAPITIASNSYATNVSSCGDGSDARISVTVTGGQAPYHFWLDGTEVGQSNNPFYAFSNLGVGTHTVSVTDVHTSASCMVSQDFNISQATQPVATILYKGSETCIGKNNGYVTLSSTGNGGVPGYTYSKDGGSTYQTSMSFTNLSPGVYSMVVKDSKGCTSNPVSATIAAGKAACPVAGADNPNSNLISPNNDIMLNKPLSLQVYPNPFASSFLLNVAGNNKEKVSIVGTDVLGRKLFEVEGSANQQYKLGANLKSGIYIVKVIQGNNVQTLKIIKE